MVEIDFSWIIEGEIAGMSQPGLLDHIEEDLLWLKTKGIKTIITLTEDPLDPSKVIEFEYHHIPVPNFCAPTLNQFELFKKIYQTAAKPIAIHCLGGVGRTGTMLSAALVIDGSSASEAINEVRKKRPGSIETEEQEMSVFRLEKMLENS